MAINQSWTESGLSGPYKELFYTYPEESARLDQDAMNRARQFGAQSAAARGQSSPRGAALNTYNRIGSDYTTAKAAQDRSDRLSYTNTMANMMKAGTQPSTLSSLFGPAGQALSYGAGMGLAQPLVSGITGLAKRGLKGLGFDATPQQAMDDYNLRRGSGGGYNYGDQPYGDMPGMGSSDAYGSLFDTIGGYNYGDLPFGDMMPYESLTDAVPWEAPDFSDAYNSIDFGEFMGGW